MHALSSVVFAMAHLPLGRCAIAVSGGGDSMALLHLALQAGLRPLVLTFDHNLRPESAAEAAWVAAQATALGLPCRLGRWDTPARRGVLAAARTARYRFFAQACADEGLTHLLVGHTLDDVAETFLIRRARGSGPQGLAVLPPQTTLFGLTVVRPLVGVRRHDLRAFLTGQGVSWLEDPTNTNPAYLRPRLRAQAAARDAAGDTAEHLAAQAAAYAAQNAPLEAAAQAWLATHPAHPLGWQPLDGLADLPDDIAVRVLGALCTRWTGAEHAPRLSRRQVALARWRLGETFTLGGLVWAPGLAWPEHPLPYRAHPPAGSHLVPYAQLSACDRARLKPALPLAVRRRVPVAVASGGQVCAVPAALDLKTPPEIGRFDVRFCLPVRGAASKIGPLANAGA